jgi:glycosyltransferase involved in cell wall biosynthesis
MRIAYITSGAGGMYCGSCMRDNTLATALTALGHECVLIPTYTPLRTDEPDVSMPRVFFGGISIFLEQKLSVFRSMPGFLDRWLSQPGLLRWVTNTFGMKTRPEDLGALTISMLRGTEGHQSRDVRDLVRWLLDDFRPDLVCLTNILISGLVPELKRRRAVPVICTLQGDDIYLEWLPPDFKRQALELIRQNQPSIDGYLTTSHAYADFMADYLSLPRDSIHVVHPGINARGFEVDPDVLAPHGPGAKGETGTPLTVGYFARICPEKGLQVLADAFHQLLQRPGIPSCQLRAAGYLGDRDRPFLRELQKQAELQGWGDRFTYAGELDHQGKVAFLRSLDVFSVPTTYREPKGLYVLEAWACGLPVVQPRHGSFPELIALSGGGLLVPPQDPRALADALEQLLLNEDLRRSLGERGRSAVRQQFQAHHMAEGTAAVFAAYVNLQRPH